MDETDQQIPVFPEEPVRSRPPAIARHVGLSQRATLTRLKALRARGVLVEIGTGPHDPKRQYGWADKKR